MTSRFIFFGAFMVFIILMLAMDLGVFHKKDHVIKIKEAAIWTAIWILLAMLFGLLLLFKAEWVHDIRCLDDLYAYVKGTDLAHWRRISVPAWTMRRRWRYIARRFSRSIWLAISLRRRCRLTTSL